MRKLMISNIVLSLLAGVIMMSACSGHTHHSSVTDCTLDKTCDECGEVIEAAKAHTPIAEATCLEDSVCYECSAVIEKAHGHIPGAEATCRNAQLCTVCSAELSPVIAHNYVTAADGKSAKCATCDNTINYKNGHTSFIPQTQNTGHFNNNIKAFYAGNVLVCGDYGLEYFKMNEKGNENYAKIVNDFAEKYPSLNVTSLLIPKACAFYSPEGFSNGEENQKNFIAATYGMMTAANIRKADAMSELSAHKGEYTYYRTDHHWTSLGAYYASRAYCTANGITPRELSDYTTVTNTGYTGSLYGYSGNSSYLKAQPDYTVAHLPKANCTLTYTSGGTTYNGQLLNLSTNNYSYMFICGDQPFTQIKTDNSTGKKLIVFKESYGNAFVPFMADYYDEIIVIDIRKDTQSVAKIIADYGITDALIINNVQGATSLQSYLRNKVMS